MFSQARRERQGNQHAAVTIFRKKTWILLQSHLPNSSSSVGRLVGVQDSLTEWLPGMPYALVVYVFGDVFET